MGNPVEGSECKILPHPSDTCNRWALLSLQAEKPLSFFISQFYYKTVFISELCYFVFRLVHILYRPQRCGSSRQLKTQ